VTTRGNQDDRDLARDADALLDADAREPIAEARTSSLAGTPGEDELASGYHGEPTVDTVYTTEATSAGGEGLTGDEIQADSPEVIRADIDQTRDEVAGTLDQIGARLDPGHLADQAKEKVREATIGRVEDAVETAGETARGIGEMVMETIKRNPIPAAMAGVGLALLWRNRADGQGQGRFGGSSYRYSDRYGFTGGEYGGTQYGGTQYGGTQSGVSGYGQSEGPGVTDRARQAADTVSSAAGDAAQNVGRTAGQVAEGAQQVASEAVWRGQQTAQQVGTSFNELVRANPLGVAVAALGAGAAVGLLIPETQPEHRILGQASDQVGRTIQQSASQAMDKVEEAADQAEQKLQESQTP